MSQREVAEELVCVSPCLECLVPIALSRQEGYELNAAGEPVCLQCLNKSTDKEQP